MPFYRLGNIVDAIASGVPPDAVGFNAAATAPAAADTAAPAFVSEAQVADVQSAGCLIYIDGASVFADQATDEPFTVGQMVYVSQVQGGGYVIHGSVK